MARRQVIAETGVRLDLGERRSTARRADDLQAPLHRSDDLRDVEDRETARQPVLKRLDEELLARDAIEVGIGVPVPDEVERLLSVELLVAGLEVDRRKSARTALRVQVAAVD